MQLYILRIRIIQKKILNPDLINLKKKSLLLMISFDQACKHEGGPAKPDSTTPKRTYKECRLQEIYLK